MLLFIIQDWSKRVNFLDDLKKITKAQLVAFC